ncbi:hypothetical protein HELRODRAFT_170304 [Helobdella robusta]|uniref:WD repeat-containing protein on Y chromosome n=1 Tax=Helobdella robusta TaxID=6412 RepID=T1F2W6_HELRO|nr:hypothetical protein HELRODRAFT_170304 [Helobdella robusta]ESO07756.1 hypothetical protein HELRODRAFT_170304 [Helobdella robusta]
MEVYLKSVQTKLNTLSAITDVTKTDDDKTLQKLIDTALRFNLRFGLESSNETLSRRTNLKIHQLLTKESLSLLREEFLNAITEKTEGLSIELFKSAMTKCIGRQLNEAELEELFYKVDVMKNNVVTWKEYSNYLLLEMDMKEKLLTLEKELLGNNIQIFKTEGRDSIKALLILPFGDFESSDPKGLLGAKDADCRYFTCSRDGVINFWSSNFQTSDTFILHSYIAKGTTLSYWVTSAEVIPEAKLIAIATTNFSLFLFRYGNNKEFEMTTKIEKFPGTITCLSYYKDDQPNNASFLTWGDEYGGVGVIAFHVNPARTAIGISPKHSINKKNQFHQFHFTDLSNNHVLGLEARYIAEIHKRYVCQVRYVAKLRSWLSCSKETCTALFIGDLVPNVPFKNRIYYSVLHGVTVFEYSEKMNFIITGGYDMLIRLWNPMAKNQKLVGVFRGHVGPVTHIMLDHRDAFLVTISECKDILVFDMSDQACIQSIKQQSFKALGKKPITAACINKKSHTVVLASNMRLGVIEGKEEILGRHALSTLTAPITTALYNPLFKQIVTGDWKSQVIVWNAFGGEKIVHFTAHTVRLKGRKVEIEIKVMSFDATYRRLVTGHSDGMVKIWNYNIAVLLQEIPVPTRFEVTALCCPFGKIFVAGCNDSVFLHIENTVPPEGYIALKPAHPSYITQMAVMPETYLASASADGTLMVYSLKTSLPQFKFNLANLDMIASVDFYKYMTNEPTIQSEGGWLNEKHTVKSKKLMKLFASSSRGNEATVLKNQVVTNSNIHYDFCVEALVYLTKRKITPRTAVLLTCMHDGRVLSWPMDLYGKCLGEFMAAYKENELLHAADVTSDDAFLVTGDSLGYIKVWDISHYHNPEEGECCDVIDSMRLPIWQTFSFVRMRKNIEMYKRLSQTDVLLPMHMKVKCHELNGYPVQSPHLINSFKSHVGGVVSLKLIEIDSMHSIISTASDMSVRIWSLQGIFFGLLGQKNMWTNPELHYGFVSNEKFQKETAEIGKSQELNDCGKSAFHMTNDEVKLIAFKESDEDLVNKQIRVEKKGSNLTESMTNLNSMINYIELAESELNDIKKSDKMTRSISDSKHSAFVMINSLYYQDSSRFKEDQTPASKFIETFSLEDFVEKKVTTKSVDIPSDLKRVGSYTTLYVLESEMNVRQSSRWIKILHTTVWIINYLRFRKTKFANPFRLPGADPSKVGVYSNNIKDLIEEYISSQLNKVSLRDSRSVASPYKNDQEKRNQLLRPLTPLSSEIFGQFYSEHYTKHRAIVPWSVAEELTDGAVCPYKNLPLAKISAKDPAHNVRVLFANLGIQGRELMGPSPGQPASGGFTPNTESEMTLVRNLKKTGWKLIWVLRSTLNFASDGEVVREVGREFQRKGPEKAKADLAKECLTRVKKKREKEDDRKPGRLEGLSLRHIESDQAIIEERHRDKL